MTAHAQPGTRGARRRAETRARLLGAARDVMGRKGVDAASIQEITDTADVGFGSFYNHFESKDAIVEALVDDLYELYETTLDQAVAHLEDPAEVFSAKVRLMLRGVGADPVLGWFLVRVGMVRERFRTGLNYRLERDVQAGVDSGRFHVADVHTAVSAIRGTALMLIWDRLDGAADVTVAETTAEYLLRMLGLDAAEAARVTRLPLPTLPAAT